MKRFIVKLVFEIYVKFGKILKKIIPLSLRWKIKTIMNRVLSDTDGNATGIEKISTLPEGLNLISYLRAEMGLGHSARLIAKALEVGDISWCGINYEKLNAVRYSDNTWQHKIVEKPVYNVNLFNINPDNLYLANMYLPKEVWQIPYNIGYILWELTEVPKEWGKGIELFQELWAPSQFIVDVLKKATKKPVYKIPYGISVDGYDEYDRDYFKLPKELFLFLIMYDVNSTAQRKNPLGAIKAYKKAFLAENKNIGLVVKVNNSRGQAKEEIANLKNELIEYNNILFIEETLSKTEVNSLINCTNSFISLHRAEGFGLVIAEAMYLGKPAIATNWSANVDFMNQENSCPVNFEIVTINKDYGSYKKGLSWAEPDYEHAAEYMKRLVNDPIYYNSIAENGCRYIRNFYSFENCAELINSRLKAICLNK